MNSKTNYLPIQIVIVYLLFTEIYFVVGPINWGYINYFKLFTFLTFAKLFLIAGYFVGTNKEQYNKPINNEEVSMLFIKFAVILSIIMNMLFIIIRLSSFSPSTIFQHIIIGLTNPSLNYYDKFGSVNSVYDAFAPIYTLSSIVIYSAMPLSLFYYNFLSTPYQLLTIINILVGASRWLIVGTNKGIVDIVIIMVSVLILKVLQNNNYHFNLFSKEKIKRTIIIIVVAFASLFVLNLFLKNIDGRLRGNYSYILHSLGNASLKNVNIYNSLSKPFYSLLVYTQAYICQGYYGLSLAFDLDFQPMFGLGSSSFLLDNLASLLGSAFLSRSYLYKIEMLYPWSSTLNWHTAYTWFANDFSFLGTIILMFFIGLYFGIVVNKALTARNTKIFIALFTTMMVMFFYFPMNNQIFNDPNSFMGVFGLNLVWFLKNNNIRITINGNHF